MQRARTLALALALAAGCSEYNREAVASYNEGMQLLRANRYSDARAKFQQSAEEDRRYDLPLAMLALSYSRQRDWPNAANALSRALTRNSNNAEYHYQLGDAYYQQATDEHNAESGQAGAQLDQARTAFQTALQHNPRMYRAHLRLGQIAELLDDPQTALREYTATIDSAPRAYPAYARLGDVYYHHQRYDEGVQVLREGLRIAPEGVLDRANMHNILGNILLKQHQMPPAVEAFHAAVDENGELTEALVNLGMTLADMPDHQQEAVLFLRRFITARGAHAPPEYLQRAQSRLAELEAAAGGH